MACEMAFSTTASADDLDKRPAARAAMVVVLVLLVLVVIIFPLHVVEIVGKASPNLGKSLGFRIRAYIVPLSLVKILI